jgi:hypothetical protein
LKRYEQCVRVPTVFFSMLMGFGLKRLADASWAVPEEKLACFIVALALFMRILFGSANHLWLNFMKTPPTEERQGRALLWDCGLLALIGMIGLILCYSGTAQFFAGLSSALALGIAGIDLVDGPITKFLTGRDQVVRDLWRGWRLINLLHAAAGGLLWLALEHEWIQSGGTLLLWLGIYALIGVILLIWDLRNQLLALNE